MSDDHFICISCGKGRLENWGDVLRCPACAAEYPVVANIPVLLPSPEQLAIFRKEHGIPISLEELRRIYDRAYEHGGLMGTELDSVYDRETKCKLLALANVVDGAELLDIGTGVGRLWDYLEIPVHGYALDPSLAGVSAAVQRHPSVIVSVSIAEFLPYPDASFDIAIAADTIEHTFAPIKAFQEICRVLKPGATFTASFPVPNSLRKWGWNLIRHDRSNLSMFVRLAQVVTKRTLLFGRPDFQPIDRDLSIDEWLNMLDQAGFVVNHAMEWPRPPRMPLAYLVSAVAKKTD